MSEILHHVLETETNVNGKGTVLYASHAGLTRISMLSDERSSISRSNTMRRQNRPKASFSELSCDGRTVIPREVRERLGLKPGDTLGYRVTDEGVLLDKAPASEADDPFVVFSEWSSEADEKAYGDL
jgi:antitoxin PrlF